MKYQSSHKMLKENPRMDIFYLLHIVRKIAISDLMNWVLKHDMFQILKRISYSFGPNDLKRAIGYGSIQIVKFLWKQVEMDKNSLFEYAIQKHMNMEMMLFLYSKKIPMTNRAFLRAIYLENLDSLNWMIQYGFVWNETHLFYAIDHEKMSVIRYFIQHHEVLSEMIYEKLLEANYIEETQMIEEKLQEKKWIRQYTRFRQMKESHFEKEFDAMHFESKSVEEEFEEIHQSHRLFDCMTLFSMVPIEDSMEKLLNFK